MAEHLMVDILQQSQQDRLSSKSNGKLHAMNALYLRTEFVIELWIRHFQGSECIFYYQSESF